MANAVLNLFSCRDPQQVHCFYCRVCGWRLSLYIAECKVQCVSGLKFLQSFFKTCTEAQEGQTVLKLDGNPDNL